MKRGRQVRIRQGMVVYASARFVVVAFDRYRETFAPQHVWAVDEEPPQRVTDKLISKREGANP